MRVRNAVRNTTLAENCEAARTFVARFKGLQLRKGLPAGSGLLITPCNSIHMFFMRFPIDAVFIDAEQTVLHIEEGIRPWRISRVVRKARSVLELPAGTASATGTRPGDRLELE
jgi:uncharacterized membrane protein (UPF0127 family)